MKKKALAGIIAFICAVNMFSAPSMLNPTGTGVGISSYSTVYAEETITDPLPSTVSDSTEYWNNTYYTTTLTKLNTTYQWTVDNCTYGIFKIEVSHKDGDDKTIKDLTKNVVGLVSVKSESRLTSHTPFAKTVIPDTVLENMNKNSIAVPDSSDCVVIGDSVYANGGTYLKEIDLTGIQYIGSSAFSGCKYITVIDIPESVQYIGESVFANSGIKTATFNNKLTRVPKNTFKGAPLGKVTFSNEELIYEIGDYAFSETTITALPISGSNHPLAIGNSAFQGCKQLADISFPDNVTVIGTSAFQGCTALKSIKTGADCRLIKAKAFYGCTALTSINLNDGLSYIGSYCFQNCTSLVNGPEMPNSLCYSARGLGDTALDKIEDTYDKYTYEVGGFTIPYGGKSSCAGMFKGCTALKSIDLPDDWWFVPESYCEDCTSLTSATLGSKVTSIYNNAFLDCQNLQDISLKSISGYIGNSAFSGCKALKAILSDTIAIIGDEAFLDCESLKSFDLVTKAVGHKAFMGCSGLTDVSLVCSIWGSYIFANCTELKTAYMSWEGGNSTPDGIFYNCVKLEDLKDTDLSSIEIVGTEAFYNCDSLVSLSMPKVIIVVDSAFEDCDLLESICPGDITIQDYGNRSFMNCKALKQAINAKVSTVGSNAFTNTNIPSVNIDGTVGNTLVINSEAFSNCAKLKEVTIDIEDNSILYEVGKGILSDCTALERVKYTGTEIPKNMLSGCSNLVTLEIPNAIDVLDYAFYNCAKLSNIEGTNTFGSIGESAFSGCAALTKTYADANTVYSGTSQYMGCESLKTANMFAITKQMFKNCKGLNTVKLENNISVIPDSAFDNCTSLTDINLGNVKDFGAYSLQGTSLLELNISGANSIGDSAFSKCNKLNVINVEADTIGKFAFQGCSSLNKAYISTNKIGASAFADCKALVFVDISNVTGYELKSIGGSAFKNTLITDLLIPESVTEIGTYAYGSNNNKLDCTIYGTAGTKAETYALDNKITFRDASEYDAQAILKSKEKPGDLNADGVVSVVDAVMLKQWLLNEETPGLYLPNIDVNGDDKVNVFDLVAEKRILLDNIDTL